MIDKSRDTRKIIDCLRNEEFEREILEKALSLRNADQEALFALARERRNVGFPNRQVEMRSVIELSNICHQECSYCRIGSNRLAFHYTICLKTFVTIVDRLHTQGRKHLLIQSGQNPNSQYIDHVCQCLQEIRNQYPDMTLILCLGSLSKQQYRKLRMAGAHRYILKFETSNAALYRQLKPHDCLEARLRCLNNLREAGFQIGSGNIVGLPGQTLNDLVDDILLLKKLDLTMGSASVFIPNTRSKLEHHPIGDIQSTLNTMALFRIMNPGLLIPSTSSLEKAQNGGQIKGLMAGANSVTIHDGTPEILKREYPIYSSNRFTPEEKYIRYIISAAGFEPL